MKIKVDFTIEIDPKLLPRLRELANVDNTQEAILFVKAEAQDEITRYLDDNGVPVTIVRDAVTTY